MTMKGRTIRARLLVGQLDAPARHPGETRRTDKIRAIDDERVLLLSLEQFRGRDGIELDQPAWTTSTLRAGKIVRMQPFWDRVNALEAAGLSE
jgi:ketosteroid isomerase-like protein